MRCVTCKTCEVQRRVQTEQENRQRKKGKPDDTVIVIKKKKIFLLGIQTWNITSM